MNCSHKNVQIRDLSPDFTISRYTALNAFSLYFMASPKAGFDESKIEKERMKNESFIKKVKERKERSVLL